MEHFDIAIIGTGSGNSIPDERYAGKRIAICEQGTFGGTCLNVSCIPTKMFVYAAEVAQTVREAARFGVDAHLDGVRWSDIVSRVFGRIDPLAVGGSTTERSSPNVTVMRATPVSPGGPAGVTGCAPTTVTSSPPNRSSSPRDHARWCPMPLPAAGSTSTPVTRSCASPSCPSTW